MPQTAKHDRLRDAFTTHKILVDTCFLMDRSFDRFLKDYGDVFQQNHILIPRKVVQELKRIKTLKDHRLQLVQAALESVETALSKGLAEVRGEQSDEHSAVADHVISRVVEQHLAQHNIIVLTNDRALRDWIYAKKTAGCFSSRKSLLVVRFGPREGTPHIWRIESTTDRDNGVMPSSTVPRAPQPRASIPSIPQPFARTSKLESDLETPLSTKEDVEKSGIVYLYDGRQVRLVKKLASGGEGTVYETDQAGILCKIYYLGRLTKGAQRKIELMVSRRVSYPAICWPTEPIRDSHGVFRGFLMSRASGEPLGHGLFIPTVWLARNPTWTRKESVRLAIRIFEGIDYLHRMEVLLGDINPMNILVKDANTVFFVDCDSFQVEGFPCPVGSINFVAPEIQGQDFTKFLRTPEHELFAMATIAFMMMMPGKPPYSHQGGADGAANIKKMHFPYPLGEKGSAGAPEGAWRFCWSHLPFPLKESFYQTFHADFQGQARLTVTTWISRLREYEAILNNSSAVFRGPTPQYGFDLSILPQNFRYLEGKGRPLPTGGATDLQKSVRRMAAASVGISPQTTSASYRQKPAPPTTPATTYSSGGTRHQSAPRASSASYPGKGEWYASLLFWPFAAPVKALVETAGVGVGGAIIGTVVLGLLLMMFGNYDGFALGAQWGALIGVIIGIFVAGASIIKVDRGIFPASGIGIVVGAIACGLYAGSSTWAFAGAALGIVIALFIRHRQIGERKAAEYMHSWWGH
jgi:rRNA-processing protein FCF1